MCFISYYLSQLTLSFDAQDPRTGEVIEKDLWVGGLYLASAWRFCALQFWLQSQVELLLVSNDVCHCTGDTERCHECQARGTRLDTWVNASAPLLCPANTTLKPTKHWQALKLVMFSHTLA